MNFGARREKFIQLCINLEVPVPEVYEMYITEETPCDYTDECYVGLNLEAAGDCDPSFHVRHVLGHYLADLHTPESAKVHGEGIFDVVADAIANILNGI